jgi:hypothetical protein
MEFEPTLPQGTTINKMLPVLNCLVFSVQKSYVCLDLFSELKALIDIKFKRAVVSLITECLVFVFDFFLTQ